MNLSGIFDNLSEKKRDKNDNQLKNKELKIDIDK